MVRRFGLTDPIRLDFPTQRDVERSNSLCSILRDNGSYSTRQDRASRNMYWPLSIRSLRIYSEWRWPNPIMLCESKEKGPLFLGSQVWDPRKYPRERYHVMPIITPAYPCMNSSYNVSATTLCIMSGEFKRGNEICKALEEGHEADWSRLFESYPFFEEYKNYLQIDIGAGDADDFRKWKGWVESRLRQLVLKIEKHTYGMLKCHPHPSGFSDQSLPLHSSYFMGLQRKQDVPVNEGEQFQFDIRGCVDEFKRVVNEYASKKIGMEICVSHVNQKDIPSFVFPSGLRPSSVLNGAVGGQKRKRVEDVNVETDSAKCPKSMRPYQNGQVEALWRCNPPFRTVCTVSAANASSAQSRPFNRPKLTSFASGRLIHEY